MADMPATVERAHMYCPLLIVILLNGDYSYGEYVVMSQLYCVELSLWATGVLMILFTYVLIVLLFVHILTADYSYYSECHD